MQENFAVIVWVAGPCSYAQYNTLTPAKMAILSPVPVEGGKKQTFVSFRIQVNSLPEYQHNLTASD